jgi:CBS domain-containing protein
MRVDEVMKTQVECVRRESSLGDAARMMRDHDVGFLPVCDAAKHPVGAVTDRDLAVRGLAQRLGPDDQVGQVMSTDLLACRPSDDIQEAEALMARDKKARIMVTDPSGKLVGVISLSDLIDRDERRAVRTLREVSSREARV